MLHSNEREMQMTMKQNALTRALWGTFSTLLELFNLDFDQFFFPVTSFRTSDLLKTVN